MTDVFGEILKVDEEALAGRITYLKDRLINLCYRLRSEIPENILDSELIENEMFKSWTIANLILQNMELDKENTSSNRLLYYMFEQCGGSVHRLLNQYSLDITKKENGSIESINLVIVEEDPEDGEEK